MTETTPAPNAEDIGAGKCPISRFAAEFNPFDEEYQQDPYPVFKAVREQEPVFYSPEIDYWIVSRYEDILDIFKDTESYSATEAGVMITPPCPAAMDVLAEADFVPSTMLVDEDAPLHPKRRRVFRKGLNDKKVADLEPYTRRFVSQCLDAIVKAGRADMVGDMTFSVPALTAFILMGVPEAEVERVRGYASRFALWLWGRPTDEQQVSLAQDYAAYLQYAREHVSKLIENPGEDYMSTAIKAWQKDGNDEVLDKTYLASIMQSHLYAAHETTTNAAASGFKSLLENHSQWAAICEDPTLIPGAVHEILRYQSSVPTWRRITTRPVRLGGYDLPAGSRVMILTGSANHDDAKFDDGETFDITRENADEHLAFGWGVHLCLGQGLARMEMRVMLEETTKRLPHLRLVEGQEWTYSPNTSFRGPDHVLVEWDPGQNPLPEDRP
ncbi:cytochrome P450 [Rhodococcus opacus]|uniref:Cytochrome P450 116 n=1 Tax=Rhodococcus opacus TaxID=37919 RepID=A0A1B1KIU2_RHOOP|nr:cytochrome P450 [Rhodococcus opacus]ANS32523.1 Cytochrome P450 116 [Rhodococcus opacus]